MRDGGQGFRGNGTAGSGVGGNGSGWNGEEGRSKHDRDGREPLALRPREAAKLLAIGQRTLWELTKKGEVPHTRVGRAVLYPYRALEEWLQARAVKGVRP